MKRLLMMGWLLFLTGCGGSSLSTTTTTTPVPQIAGAWEITATSEQQPGYSTLIESNLQEATASGTGTITATGADQLVLIGQHPAGGLFFGGLCPGATTENLTGTLSTYDDLSLTLTEGAAIYTLAGTVNTSGKSMTGTYTFSSGSCPDSGTFAGIQVSALAGTYTGTLNFTNGNQDSATAILTEGVPSSFTVALTLTGADNTTVTLTGFVVGNVFSVQGTLDGQAVSYYGYYDFSEKDLYMVDATSDTPIGTLFAQ
ncbi:MAG: hypothetical protein WB421_04490 [Terriglobales bacterium]|jgi:hypothetical protein